MSLPMATPRDLIRDQLGVEIDQHVTYGDDGGVAIIVYKQISDGRRQYVKSRLVRWREFEETKQVGSFLYPSQPTHAARVTNHQRMNAELERVGLAAIQELEDAGAVSRGDSC